MIHSRGRISSFVTGLAAGLMLLLVVTAAIFYSGVAVKTKTQSVTSTITGSTISIRNETVVSLRNNTVTSIQTSVLTSTTTSYTTESITLTSTSTATLTPVLSKNPLIVIASVRFLVALPSGYSIYNATVVNAATQAVTNVTMVLENTAFLSHVTNQNRLLPGQSTIFNFSYPSGLGGLPNPTNHLVLFYGTFQDGQPFAYVESIGLNCRPGAPICS